jgi:hypothetical protein
LIGLTVAYTMAMRSFAHSLVAIFLTAAGGAAAHASPELPDAAALAKLDAQFAPVELRVDVSRVPESERKVLAKLIQAAKVLDGVFLRQTWAGNPSLLLQLSRDDSPLGRARLRYFLRHKGPWDRQNEYAPFVPGVPGERPPQGGFYPESSTKEEVEKWIATLPEAQKTAATGFYTTVRRAPGGGFTLVPYSVEYQGELEQAARLLDEAAALTAQPTLKKFLSSRARPSGLSSLDSCSNSDGFPAQV